MSQRDNHERYLGPRAFQFVDLKERRTWLLASLEDWVALRRQLDERLGPMEERDENRRQLLEAASAASQKLEDREAARGRALTNVRSPAQQTRWNRIYRCELVSRNIEHRGLSTWEKEFYFASRWLDDLKELTGQADATGRIASELLERAIRSEVLAAQHVRDRRDLMEAQLSNKADRGNKYNVHPYLPHPLELIQICSLARLMLRHLARGFSLFKELGLEQDRYGAAFPCPSCETKHLALVNAAHCCEAIDAPIENDEMADALVLRGRGHREILVKFMRELLLAQFELPRSLDDLVEWNGWDKLSTRNVPTISNEFLGRLFSVPTGTIKRKLASSTLADAYARFPTAGEKLTLASLRDWDMAVLARRGWHVRQASVLVRSPYKGKTFYSSWPGIGGR